MQSVSVCDAFKYFCSLIFSYYGHFVPHWYGGVSFVICKQKILEVILDICSVTIFDIGLYKLNWLQ